jgi:hypothetical protein
VRVSLYYALIFASALTLGFILAKNKYSPKETKSEVDMALEQERSRTMEIAKNAYGLGCLQSFERVCSLLKKDESKRCVKYSDSYCKDASNNYTIKLKAILKGPH